VKLGIREEERLTEDEIARRKLGPRGVPGGQDFAKMTPQQEKNIPKDRRLRRPYCLTGEIFCFMTPSRHRLALIAQHFTTRQMNP